MSFGSVTSFCTEALVAANVVLTAAHCLSGELASPAEQRTAM